MNPRLILWLRAMALAEDAVAPHPDGVRMLELHGMRLPWTLHFQRWMRERWREWARELGYEDGHGSLAHEHALMCGHRAGEFDLWLRQWVDNNRRQS